MHGPWLIGPVIFCRPRGSQRLYSRHRYLNHSSSSLQLVAVRHNLHFISSGACMRDPGYSISMLLYGFSISCFDTIAGAWQFR